MQVIPATHIPLIVGICRRARVVRATALPSKQRKPGSCFQKPGFRPAERQLAVIRDADEIAPTRLQGNWHRLPAQPSFLAQGRLVAGGGREAEAGGMVGAVGACDTVVGYRTAVDCRRAGCGAAYGAD